MPNTMPMAFVDTISREIGAHQRAERRGDLKEHADANVREAFAHVSGGGARRRRDNRDERGADGVAQIDVEQQREHRHNHHAPAQAGERTEQAGQNRGAEDGKGEGENGHARRLKAY